MKINITIITGENSRYMFGRLRFIEKAAICIDAIGTDFESAIIPMIMLDDFEIEQWEEGDAFDPFEIQALLDAWCVPNYHLIDRLGTFEVYKGELYRLCPEK